MASMINVSRVLRTAIAIAPYLAASAIAALAVGLWLGLVVSPPDYQQGEHVRIMYVHVPSAYLATTTYFVLGVVAIAGLVSRSPLTGIFIRAVVPIGASFSLLVLLSGAIWGKPTWGTWWVWDARLTSAFVLFLLYVGHMVLTANIADRRRADTAGQILLTIGMVNLPIIKFSVDWWQSLHQPASLIRLGGPTIDPALLRPLLVMFVAATLGWLWLVIVRFHTALVRQRRAQQAGQSMPRVVSGQMHPGTDTL